MKLSICMMVKDEEKNLKRCLESLQPILDTGLTQLIIVDTGSSDNTVNIAKQYTDEVYFHEWNKDFSSMRNITISYATGEWLFIIDADEKVNDSTKLIHLLAGNDLDGYNTGIIQIKNLSCYKEESNYSIIPSPRLFRNDGEFRYVGTVHNQPLCKGPEISIDLSLTHYGYIGTDKALMEKKYKRTVELLKLELEKEPEHLYYLYQLGISYDMHGDHKLSLEVFRKAYGIMKTKRLVNNREYVYILGNYGRIAFTNHKLDECFDIVTHVLKLQPEYVDMYYILGWVEKQRGRSKQKYEAFNKYVNLVNQYSKLAIAKDLTLIMYYINDSAKSVAYSEIIAYYIEQKEYKKAYKLIHHLNLKEHRIYYTPKILVNMGNYEELNLTYNELLEEKDKNSFLIEIENNMINLEDEERKKCYNIFKVNNDVYGKYSKLQLMTDRTQRKVLAQEALAEVDFNTAPKFYSQFLVEVGELNTYHIKHLKEVERLHIEDVIQYAIENNSNFKIELETYLKHTNLQDCALDMIKVHLGIIKVLLLLHLNDEEEISPYYESLFNEYINLGILWVQSLYQIKHAESIYKCISMIEDRFFMQMYLAHKNKVEDKKKMIQYILEAVKTYEAMAKYIDSYKNTLLQTEIQQIERKDEFEQYKQTVKEQIAQLIHIGATIQARELLQGYKEIVPDDIENYSLEAVIHMIEGNLDEASLLVDQGLEKEPYHEELLANKAYLMDITEQKEEAIYNVSKLKLFCPHTQVKVKDLIATPSNNNQPLRILHGSIEIANQMYHLTEGLNQLGQKAQSINYWPNYLGDHSQMALDISQYNTFEEKNRISKELAAKLIAENDVFHFHIGTTLTMDYSDLPLLRELDKKVIMQYWGSDVRLYSKAIKLNPYAKVKNTNEESIKRELERISKYISHCLVDYELGEYVKDYFENIHYTRVAIDLEQYKPTERVENKKLLIVHAPTSPEIKGTQHILSAVEALQQNYDFEFKLVQGMNHEEAKKIYEQADLIIDQINVGSYGALAVEAMAMGKPVICWISDFMKQQYPKELPIIRANPENIKERIEFAINNADMLPEIGAKGRAYAEKYHNRNDIAKQILDIYNRI